MTLHLPGPTIRLRRLALSSALLLLLLAGCGFSANRYHEQFMADLKVLKICEKHDAGDRVYRTVADVKGVFKATTVEPYPDWGDQYGMKTPWLATYFRSDIGSRLGEPRGGAYWFIEAPPSHGDVNKSGYRRAYLYESEEKPQANEFQSSFPPLLSSKGFLLFNNKKSGLTI